MYHSNQAQSVISLKELIQEHDDYVVNHTISFWLMTINNTNHTRITCS